jgi:hypothetical protein
MLACIPLPFAACTARVSFAAWTYGMGIAQSVAQIDNCACGGTDKGPSIHSTMSSSRGLTRRIEGATGITEARV